MVLSVIWWLVVLEGNWKRHQEYMESLLGTARVLGSPSSISAHALLVACSQLRTMNTIEMWNMAHCCRMHQDMLPHILVFMLSIS